ncbi:cytochrome c oxidase assembly protein subunit 15 [Paenibacillus algorifonticola]|uniref:Cytochrome c oxidase assembly protein subunit 15 n=1 Tax=Paenibacillus algorifonticola TaxID=684063 RepID=A0A1I2HP10_9BACL|nr:heme A synthase [Paenibacillus algorifonticola]SFF30567.1 cytochrome c oxidase assembly protein subunit 15 [Paenibacillus algorifonticola]
MVSSRFRKFSVATSLGMLIILLNGALVTNMDAGRGCGDDWPLCHGKFIPAYTLESFIEYTHRLTTGIEGLLVVGMFIASFVLFKRDKTVFKQPLVFASSSLFFTIVQALMGAAAVKWPQSPWVMAIHFGISLMAFASTLLLVFWAYRNRNGQAVESSVPRSFFPRLLGLAVYIYVVIYLGAYIRHTDSGGGCLDWPLCNGKVIPDFEGAETIVFIHRIGAVILSLAIAGVFLHIRRKSGANQGLAPMAKLALILVLTQVLSGALLTLTITNSNWFVFTNLLHNLIVSALFGVIMDMLVRSWRLREGAR